MGPRCSWSFATERYLIVLKIQVEFVGYLLLRLLLVVVVIVIVVVVAVVIVVVIVAVVYELGGKFDY